MGRPKASKSDTCVESFMELDYQARTDTLAILTKFHKFLSRHEPQQKQPKQLKPQNGANAQKDLITSGETE